MFSFCYETCRLGLAPYLSFINQHVHWRASFFIFLKFEMPYLSSFISSTMWVREMLNLKNTLLHSHFLSYQLSRQKIIGGCGIVGLHALSMLGSLIIFIMIIYTGWYYIYSACFFQSRREMKYYCFSFSCYLAEWRVLLITSKGILVFPV